MAFTTQVIEDSQRNYIIKVTGTAIEAAALLVDVSALAVPCAAVKLWDVRYDVAQDNVVTILWDATADVIATYLIHADSKCYADIGGINNNADAGKTGDVNITVLAATPYSFVAWFVKKNPTIPL